MKKRCFILFITAFSNCFLAFSYNIHTTDSIFYANIDSLYEFANTHKPYHNIVIFLETLNYCEIFKADIEYNYAIKVTLTKKDVAYIKHWYRNNRKKLNYSKVCQIYFILNELSYPKCHSGLQTSTSLDELEKNINILFEKIEGIRKEPTLLE